METLGLALSVAFFGGFASVLRLGLARWLAVASIGELSRQPSASIHSRARTVGLRLSPAKLAADFVSNWFPSRFGLGLNFVRGLAMGRGRQKAKNTKVARELKYFSPNTDLNALEREIGTNNDDPQYEDKWADLYEDDAEPGEEPGETPAAENSGDSDSSASDSGSSD